MKEDKDPINLVLLRWYDGVDGEHQEILNIDKYLRYITLFNGWKFIENLSQG